MVQLQIQSEDLVINLNETNETILYEGDKFLNVKIDGDLPEFIKVIVEGVNETEAFDNLDYINHVISYYKDPSFFVRKKLSQSLSGTTFMWLNKGQVEDMFYLSVECAKSPCKYSLSFIPSKLPSINLGEQYTYYITEESIKSEFNINFDSLDQKIFGDKTTIVVWARGSKNLKTELNVNNTKHTEYNAYIVNSEDIVEDLKLTIEGKLGDLVKIGALVYEEFNNTLQNPAKDNGVEYVGFLKRGVLEENCFKIPIEKQKNLELNIVPYDKIFLEITFDRDYDEEYNLICLNFSSYRKSSAQVDEIFYAIQFIYDFKDDGQGLNKYPHIEPEIYHYRNFYEGDILVLDQIEPEDDFKYLSILSFSSMGNIKMYLHKCTTYPLCKIDEDAVKNSTLIHEYYNLYPYSITKEEIALNRNYSIIGREQFIFLITCEDGYQQRPTDKGMCRTSFVSYTNKDKIPMIGYLFVHERKDDENHFYPFLYDETMSKNKNVFVGIKKFVGDITVTLNKEPLKKFENENNQVYYIEENKDLSFSIKANEDSIYTIEVYDNETSYPVKDAFLLGEGNYLF